MGESMIAFLDTWSPIDIVLIAQNFDRFLWGALVTLQLTVISLIVGGLLSIPLAIIRSGNNPFLNAPVWAFTYLFVSRHTAAGANLPDLLWPRSV